MPRIKQNLVKGGVQAVSLAMRILEQLATSNEPCRLTDLADTLDSSKTRIYRHLRTLINLGYVVQDPSTERYRASIRLAQLGFAVANQSNLISIAGPIMRRVRDVLRLTVVLSKVDLNQVYVVEKTDGPSPLAISVLVGTKLDLHCNAQGKVALAFGPDEAVEAAIKAGLEVKTSRTIVDPKRLRKEIRDVRGRGWAMVWGEQITVLAGLAVPIFGKDQLLVATLSVLGSIDEISREPSASQTAELMSASREISASLAGTQIAASS